MLDISKIANRVADWQLVAADRRKRRAIESFIKNWNTFMKVSPEVHKLGGIMQRMLHDVDELEKAGLEVPKKYKDKLKRAYDILGDTYPEIVEIEFRFRNPMQDWLRDWSQQAGL